MENYVALVRAMLVTLLTGELYGLSLEGAIFHVEERDSKVSPITHLNFSSRNATDIIDLYLTKSSINTNAPLFTICGSENFSRVCPEAIPSKNMEYYTDQEKSATMSVIRENSKDDVWTGQLTINNKMYDVSPISSNSSRTEYRFIHTPELQGTIDYTIRNPQRNSSSDSQNLKRRRKRQTGKTLGVELLIVIDNVIFQTWYDESNAIGSPAKLRDTENRIKRYFAYIVNGMDLRYRAISDSRFNIYIKLVGYVVARGDVVLPPFSKSSTRGAVNADVILAQFRDWVQETEGLPAYDHVMLFTGHDIYTIKDRQKLYSVTGLAYLGEICTLSSVSLIEYHGGFSSTGIATHEMGHSLGSTHDGDRNNCDSNDQYIMTGKAKPTTNPTLRTHPWMFSHCSVDAFAKMFEQLKSSRNRNCLFNTATVFDPTAWEKYVRQKPGQWFHVDEICKQFLGPTSYMCRDLLTSQAEVCTALWCHRPNTNQCRQHISPRGTSCGNKKWCINGKCIHDEKAPVRQENCVHGNHPGIVHDNKTCEQLVNSEPYYCYQKYVKSRCCKECQKYRVMVLGCEYGNRQTKCPEQWCDHQGEKRDKILSQCCATCKHGTPYTTKATTRQPQTTRSGCIDRTADCQSRVRDTPSECYNTSFRQSCCVACKNIKSSQLGTPYTTEATTRQPQTTSDGCHDRTADCQSRVRDTPSECYHTSFRQSCCVACKNIESPQLDCEYGDRSHHSCVNVTKNECVASSSTQHACCARCQTLMKPVSFSWSVQANLYSTVLLLATSVLAVF